jgi:glyoxylase-like metal-dependent hydrolase (beta-lactamase superfamily II)
MEVASGIHRMGSGFVNWFLVQEGQRLTVVDAGLPGQWPQLVAGLASMGRSLADVDALVLTHAHVDHVGFGSRLEQESRATVRVHTSEAGTAVRKFPPFRLFLNPSSWPFLAHGLRQGLLSTPSLDRRTTFGDGEVLDVPGQLKVVHTPGHTAGSCVLHVPDRGVVFTGDALVTFDPYTRGQGPRMMLDGVHEDPAQARASLAQIADLEADILLPGHGDPWTGGSRSAVERALQT